MAYLVSEIRDFLISGTHDRDGNAIDKPRRIEVTLRDTDDHRFSMLFAAQPGVFHVGQEWAIGLTPVIPAAPAETPVEDTEKPAEAPKPETPVAILAENKKALQRAANAVAGEKGGNARKKKLTREERQEISRKANAARWGKVAPE